MVREPNPSPRERQIAAAKEISGKIIEFGETPKPVNIRKPKLPPRPPKKS